MGALRQLPEQVSGWLKLWKGLGLVLLIYGATFLIGVAAGGKDTLQPLQGILPAGGAGQQGQVQHLQFKQVKGVAGLQRELAAAKAAGQPVMLDFYADWCTYCKTMEKKIFPNPQVGQAVQGFTLLQADITRMDDDDKALLEHLALTAPPALYFWDRQGTFHKNLRLVGEPTVPQLLERAAKVSQ
jgi:thiol:disulfide interchange protein DsbD